MFSVQRIDFRIVFLAAFLVCSLVTSSRGKEPAADEVFPGKVRLILPPVIYAAPGIECNIYFDNIILALDSRNFAFWVTSPKGLQFEERWAFTPTKDDVGEFPVVVEVRDESNDLVARGTTTVRVAAPNPEAEPATLLIVGDSLTEYSVYPRHILTLSQQEGATKLRFIGSRGAGNMPPTDELRHEGYSGWTAEAFATIPGALSRSGYYTRGATGSPFIYESKDGSKELDFARYCDEFNGGKGPDLLTIGLGTNDVFTANDENVDETMDRILKYYDVLIDSMRKVSSATRLGVQLPNPASRSQDGFRNYIGLGKQTSWQYRRNQHRLVERLIEHYGGRTDENIYVVPNYLNLDTVHGFPTWSPPINDRADERMTRVNNGTHPSEPGYRQIGDVVYSWIVNMQASGKAEPAPAEKAESQPDEQPATAPKKVAWAGFGTYRVLLQVDPIDLGNRDSDTMPAQTEIDWKEMLKSIGAEGKADMRSIQVMQVDAESGRPILYADYAYQRGPYDRAFRWYDASIPYEFSEVLAPSTYTDGERRRRTNIRAGYMYNAVGDWEAGKLTWAHTQTGKKPSYYAVYFDRMGAKTIPPEGPPTGFLGDAMPRHERWSDNTTGADSTQIALDDWNDDGLFDIVYGEQYGQLFYVLNQGTREAPKFGAGRMIFESDGKPLDIGVHAAPLVIDWDGDGAKDLLVGTYKNRIGFFRNVGSNQERSFEFQGFLRDSTGEFLALPVTPVAQKSEGVFKEDYFPVLTGADWDKDGDEDLLCGGYITGRVYFYRNVGRRDGLPLLELVGPVEADGQPINVRDWCAAPHAADLNDDGLLDLVVGAYTWHTSDIDRPSFLRYFVNTGTASEPKFKEQPLPVQGRVPSLRLPHPRVVDANNDGLPDLIVSTGSEIVVYPNVGSPNEPMFDLEHKPIRAAWGNTPVDAGHQVLDWNQDGLTDLVNGYTVHLNSGIGSPYFWTKSESVLPAGKRIEHRVDLGDGHFYPVLHDLDQDGKVDVLFGDYHGHVWFHRNESSDQDKKFDKEGKKLETSDGEAIKVGPVNADIENDFQALQGARTTLTAGDFDNDGLDDLMVGDTYGKVRYFKNLGPKETPRFAPAELIADLKARLHVQRADWNKDGRLDVIVSGSSHKIHLLLNEGDNGAAKFGNPVAFDVEVKGPTAMVTDLNGDGDEDLLVNGTQGTTFVERSFLEHGYVPARVLAIESVSKNAKD